MIILSIWGELQPIILSKKLGMYISNLQGSEHEDWIPYLEEQLIIGRRILELKTIRTQKEIEEDIASIYGIPPNPIEDWAKSIVNKMVYLDFDCSQHDMPLGGLETNCFLSRSCEEDYAEKIIDFMTGLTSSIEPSLLPSNIPMCIYSPSKDREDFTLGILWGGKAPDEYIEGLKRWGQYFDNFLITKNDYLLLDYLVNACHFDYYQDEYHILKTYSLCQLFLEKKHEKELDTKLPYFIRYYDVQEKNEESALFLRRIRNKLAHGDFEALDKLLEQYANRFMDETFWYDYYEASRRNWIVGQICMVLDGALKSIIEMLFTDRSELDRIRSMPCNNDEPNVV